MSDMFDRYAAEPQGGIQYKHGNDYRERDSRISTAAVASPEPSATTGIEEFVHGARDLVDIRKLRLYANGKMRWNIQVRCGRFYSRLWEALLPFGFLYAWKECCLFTDKVYGGLNEREGLERLAEIIMQRAKNTETCAAFQVLTDSCKGGDDGRTAPSTQGTGNNGGTTEQLQAPQ